MAIFRLLSFTQAPSPDSVGSSLPEGAFIFVTVVIVGCRGRGGRTRKKARPLSRPRPGVFKDCCYLLFVIFYILKYLINLIIREQVY